MNLLTSSKEDISFSPEHIRPYPKAPPRKSNAGRKKRKTVILTDTPEKNALEEQKLRKGRTKSAKKIIIQGKKTEEKAQAYKIEFQIESSEEEE